MDHLIQRVLDRQFAKRVADRWEQRQLGRDVADRHEGKKVAARYLEKTAAETTRDEWQQALKNNKRHLEYTKKMIKYLEKGEQPPNEPNISLENAKKNIKGLQAVIRNIEEGLKRNKAAAGSGAANKKYLDSLPPAKKAKILKHIAKHYGVSVREIEKELIDRDAENLFEYAATDRAMAMEILRDFKQQRLMASKTAKKGVALYLAGPMINGRVTVKIKTDETWSFEDLLGTVLKRWGPKFSWADQNPKLPTFKTPKDREFGIVRADNKPMSKDEMKAIDRKLKL
jgi:hypothetical protein